MHRVHEHGATSRPVRYAAKESRRMDGVKINNIFEYLYIIISLTNWNRPP